MSVSREDNYTGVFDGKVGYGRNPAVVVIDFTLAYTTPGSPFFAEGVVRAVADTAPLLQAARAAGIPVIHTKVMYHPSGADGGWFVRKVPALRKLVPGEPLAEIDPKVAPLAEEVVIVKQYPSPFFGTPLAPMLATLGVDTLILAGCSTSGCVRAGALDGVQHGYRVIVPRECVGDRHDGPHDANLFDINAKYGDVVGRDEVIQYLANLAKRND
ncbi:MAG: isochorismatase family protein [Roseomonas sp.]|jgi:maleamate amidohydrolase|nr:isochorismatase family protein [Roseomonas sp.]MCA3291928.1 isochorismatase family protein [Roseomonas sp.]MCA3295290.1 isochorismatase family protein [Roseomonas sp.]